MRWRPFLMGLETECQTGFGPAAQTGDAVLRLFEELGKLAPSLPCGGGLFNAYGRVYLDGSHLELASAEADSPYQLAQFVEQQETLVRSAMATVQAGGFECRLSNANHDGLLRDGAPSWGTHENYLLGVAPSTLIGPMLPFLATRNFAGAGGVTWPSGAFVAGTRLHLLQQDSGGSTTQQRALFSTSREEPLTQESGWHRLHLILGDGHRSQFSLALKLGTTALVAWLLEVSPNAIASLPGTPSPGRGRRAFWMQAAREFNRLARPGEPLRADPMALRVQRVYLDTCCHLVERGQNVPAWVPQLLSDWEITLGALASHDEDWLGRHLDPWIKHNLFTEYLRQAGADWSSLAQNSRLFNELALLNQDYHSLGHDTVFQRSEAAGLLDHRVAEPIPPGSEPVPFVPQTTTRATGRSQFLKDHATERGWCLDWMQARHIPSGRCVSFDPPIVEGTAARAEDS